MDSLFIYVDNEDQLHEAIDRLDELPDDSLIALDTEAYPDIVNYGNDASGLDPNTAKLRLISLYWKGLDAPYIIDIMYVGTSKLIKDLIIQLSRLYKVAHNAVYDIKIMRSHFGIFIPKWYCTKVAMTTLGVAHGWKASRFRGHGLKDLSRDYFDIILDKELGKSDWSIPILSHEQLLYSGYDATSPEPDKCESILLDGFQILKEANISIGQEKAFYLDQQAMFIIAKMEYTGLPVSTKVIDSMESSIEPIVDNLKMVLCTSLKFNPKKKLVNNGGSLSYELVIPDWANTLLNNNKGLVAHMNKVLEDRTGKGLSNLQAETLDAALKSLEDKSDEDIGIDVTEDDIKFSTSLINDLLSYKQKVKLLSEVRKYRNAINIKTGCLHTSTNVIGTCTSRMSSGSVGGKVRLNIQQISTIKLDVDMEESPYTSSSIIT